MLSNGSAHITRNIVQIKELVDTGGGRARICKVALKSPLRKTFDYLLPDTLPVPLAGARVKVPFGNSERVGFVVENAAETAVPGDKLKAITEILDPEPLIPGHLFQFFLWAANYYQHPLGDALFSMTPVALRSEKKAPQTGTAAWRLSNSGQGLPATALSRAPRQQQLLNLLQDQEQVNASDLKQAGISRATVLQLVKKGLVEACWQKRMPDPESGTGPITGESPHLLNREQQTAVEAVNLDGYHCYLLQGETGSGKTEVYLQLIHKTLQQGKQAIVLVPEINLTPQTVHRFEKRFTCPIAVVHSGLTEKERYLAWEKARAGTARIIIGTRSAIFTPLQTPGLIVVDEEHDSSFKQQEGFRYSARDLAVARGHRENVPVVLGSATPSLESIFNCQQGRYQQLFLSERQGSAIRPKWVIQDMRQQEMKSGFTHPLIEAINITLTKGEQVLVFLNRRGYAPKLSCNICGWIAECPHCDARFTLHRKPDRLICHHCENVQSLPGKCPECHGRQLGVSGQGTVKTEETLEQLFPNYPVYRIDRDSTRSKNAMAEVIEKIHRNKPAILVGTQMLAKGHHFPNVTLVAMLDVDNGLFSPDFRGAEKIGQLLIQVAGRCGRGDKQGTVFVQSFYCGHPIIETLSSRGYGAFSQNLLVERRAAAMPPFRHMAIFRAESSIPQQAEKFLESVRQEAEKYLPGSNCLTYAGPLANALERKRGKYRYQLVLVSSSRKQLHDVLAHGIAVIESGLESRRVRWHVDVDPVESI